MNSNIPAASVKPVFFKRFLNRLAFAPVMLLLFFIAGCEDMVSDVDAPEVEAKLVVTSFIAPDNDYITARVQLTSAIYTTRPAYNDSGRLISDATVWISNGTDSVQLFYNHGEQLYKVSQNAMAIVPGQTYYLTVTAPGNYSAKAHCTVPSLSPPDLEIENIDTTDENGQAYIMNLRFKDLKGEGNYYRVAVGKKESWAGEYYNAYEIHMEHGEPYVSDKNSDEQYFSYTTYEIYKNQGTQTTVYLTICLTDEHYYKFHKGIYNYEGDNPFAEPYPIYSNVEGGLGVFAAYVRKLTIMEL